MNEPITADAQETVSVPVGLGERSDNPVFQQPDGKWVELVPYFGPDDAFAMVERELVS